MTSELTTRPKQLLDPFIVAKLDLKSVGFFEFPKISTEKNKYKLRQ
jgi:hypothetical protein